MTDPNFESNLVSPEIFSFGKSPIWEEHPSQPVTDSDRQLLEHFFSEQQIKACHRVAGKIPITHIYGPRIKIGLSETSSCFVVRSEHHYNRDEHRHSLRKHIFESNWDEQLAFSIPDYAREALSVDLSNYLVENFEAVDSAVQIQIQSLVTSVISQGEWRSPNIFANSVYESLRNLGFEKIHAKTIVLNIFVPYGEPVLRYRPIHPNDRWGKYLGFLDLRLYSHNSPVALALLVPPRAFRHDPKLKIILGEYGPLFGGPGFACCPYTMHDESTSGALCAQATAINALSILADRGARLMGGYTLTYLGRRRVPSKAFDGAKDCLFRPTVTDPNTSNAFRIDGMTFDELSKLLGGPFCRTSVDDIRLPFPVATVREEQLVHCPTNELGKNSIEIDTGKLSRRLIHGYVNARCPIILYVESEAWYGHVCPDSPLQKLDDDRAHSVVIVGARYTSNLDSGWNDPYPRAIPKEGVGMGLEISQLIVNDPGYSPFLKVDVKRCFQAARLYNNIERTTDFHSIHMLCVTPSKVETHAFDCIRALFHSSRQDATVGDFARWLNFVDRKQAKELNSDYRIELLHRDDLLQTLFNSASHPVSVGPAHHERDEQWQLNFESLLNAIKQLKNSWYWCVAGYQNNSLSSLWLFDSQRKIPEGVPWDLSVHWNEMGWMCVQPSKSNENQPYDRQVEQNIKSRKTLPDRLGLQTAVMTSCSEKPLRNLVDELRSVASIRFVDLYVLREIDIRDIELHRPGRLVKTNMEATSADPFSSSLTMFSHSNVGTIADWAEERLSGTLLSCLATFFPNITSFSQEKLTLTSGQEKFEVTRSEIARAAIANCVCLALELHRRGVMPKPIVEIVAGTCLDECFCSNCIRDKQSRGTSHYMFESTRDAKIKMLCWELTEVCRLVRQRSEEFARATNNVWAENWAFALEMEPGATYVINDTEAMTKAIEIASRTAYNTAEVSLKSHLGLNLDTAHARIVKRDAKAITGIAPIEKIPKVDFAALKDYIVHAHISDNPGMHTRDQVVGKWSPVERSSARDYEYLDLLTAILNEKRAGCLPFSGVIALELEGCSRMSWIFHSVSTIKFMTEFAKNYA